MEAAMRLPDKIGRGKEGEGEREGLSLGFGYASSHLYHDVPHKPTRTDTSPFWTVSRSPATGAAAAPSNGSRARPPPSSPRTLASPPNSGLVGGGEGTAVFAPSTGVSCWSGTPRTLQPLSSPFSSPGLGGDATWQLCSPFTAAQWQELHRQALIFKYMMASTPVPTELLFGPRPLPDAHALISNLGRGGDYLNLRFTANSGDVEPGRCRRTDGKKWRCSRDVAPGQKYCERHVHRARPRSRKPVELDVRADPAAAADGAAAVSTAAAGMNRSTPPATTGPASATARPGTQSSRRVLPSGPNLKFPFQFMVPQDKKLRNFGSGGVDAEAEAGTQQWQLLHSKMAPKSAPSFSQQQQKREDDQLNLNCNTCPFPSADISSSEDFPGRRDSPRLLFIDAWSRENPFHGVAICDNKDSHQTNKSGGSSLGSLSPSNLTLSMSGTCRRSSGSTSDDQDQFQMGLRPTDSGKMLAPGWMSSTVSPMGGPLAEVLQTSSTVSSFWNERAGGESNVARGSAGLIDLMTSCDGEGTSPRGFPSPTGVLQKAALVSLSDSSSNSSPTFGPGPRPELALQWASRSN